MLEVALFPVTPNGTCLLFLIPGAGKSDAKPKVKLRMRWCH